MPKDITAPQAVHMMHDLQNYARQAGDNKIMLTPDGTLTYEVPEKKQNRVRRITARIAKTLRKFFGFSYIDKKRENAQKDVRKAKDEQEIRAARFFCRYLSRKYVTFHNLKNLPAVGEHNNVINTTFGGRIDKFTGNGLNAVIDGAKDKAVEISKANEKYAQEHYAILDEQGNLVAGSKAEAILKAMGIQLGKLDNEHKKQVVELYNKEIRLMGQEKFNQWSDEDDICDGQLKNQNDIKCMLRCAAKNREFCKGIFRWCDQYTVQMTSFMDAFSREDIYSAATMFVKMIDSRSSCFDILKDEEKKNWQTSDIESLYNIVAAEALQKFSNEQKDQTMLKDFMRKLCTDQGKQMLEEMLLSASALRMSYDELGLFGLPQPPNNEEDSADIKWDEAPGSENQSKKWTMQKGKPFRFEAEKIPPQKPDRHKTMSVFFFKQCLFAFEAASEPEDMLLFSMMEKILHEAINIDFVPEFYGINTSSANKEMRTKIYHAYANEFESNTQ